MISRAISAASASANTGRSRKDHRYSLSDFDSTHQRPGVYSMTRWERSGWLVTGHTEASSSVVKQTLVTSAGAGKHSTWATGSRRVWPSIVSPAGEVGSVADIGVQGRAVG